MRDLPRHARVAIISLYIQYRTARRLTDVAAKKFGCCDGATCDLREQARTLKQALRMTKTDTRANTRFVGGAHHFIDHVITRNRFAGSPPLPRRELLEHYPEDSVAVLDYNPQTQRG